MTLTKKLFNQNFDILKLASILRIVLLLLLTDEDTFKRFRENIKSVFSSAVIELCYQKSWSAGCSKVSVLSEELFVILVVLKPF